MNLKVHMIELLFLDTLSITSKLPQAVSTEKRKKELFLSLILFLSPALDKLQMK